MAEVAASYAVSNYGAKKIGIFYCSDDYGSGAMHTITKWCDANGVEYYEVTTTPVIRTSARRSSRSRKRTATWSSCGPMTTSAPWLPASSMSRA